MVCQMFFRIFEISISAFTNNGDFQRVLQMSTQAKPLPKTAKERHPDIGIKTASMNSAYENQRFTIHLSSTKRTIVFCLKYFYIFIKKKNEFSGNYFCQEVRKWICITEKRRCRGCPGVVESYHVILSP